MHALRTHPCLVEVFLHGLGEALFIWVLGPSVSGLKLLSVPHLGLRVSGKGLSSFGFIGLKVEVQTEGFLWMPWRLNPRGNRSAIRFVGHVDKATCSEASGVRPRYSTAMLRPATGASFAEVRTIQCADSVKTWACKRGYMYRGLTCGPQRREPQEDSRNKNRNIRTQVGIFPLCSYYIMFLGSLLCGPHFCPFPYDSTALGRIPKACLAV